MKSAMLEMHLHKACTKFKANIKIDEEKINQLIRKYLFPFIQPGEI